MKVPKTGSLEFQYEAAGWLGAIELLPLVASRWPALRTPTGELNATLNDFFGEFTESVKSAEEKIHDWNRLYTPLEKPTHVDFAELCGIVEQATIPPVGLRWQLTGSFACAVAFRTQDSDWLEFYETTRFSRLAPIATELVTFVRPHIEQATFTKTAQGCVDPLTEARTQIQHYTGEYDPDSL